jgi:hypothetical protein
MNLIELGYDKLWIIMIFKSSTEIYFGIVETARIAKITVELKRDDLCED